MARIHPLACVDPAAQIADDAEIGPFCVIGPDVSIASGCRLIAHVHVACYHAWSGESQRSA